MHNLRIIAMIDEPNFCPNNDFPQAWISEDRLVLGSDNGRVQLFEVGELKNEFRVSLLPRSQEGSAHSSKLSL